MAISIKDPAPDALARAKRQHDKTKLVDDLLQISERTATDITHPVHSSDHAQCLYDELGLPR